MNQSLIIKKLYGDGLLKNIGYALDLGCGKSTNVLSLASLGFEVDAVDFNNEIVNALADELKKEENKSLKINLFNQKIQEFDIKKEKYDCIIANNSLPLIDSKEKVFEIIKNVVNGLKKDGCLYLTLFGTKDEWVTKKDMSFFEYDEIKNRLDSLDIKFYHSNIEEGFGKTNAGNIKYWHVFRFIYIKN